MPAPGGLQSIKYSIMVANKVGWGQFLKTIRSKNTCKTCALGMGGQMGGMRNERGEFPEICKKSMQAQLTDIQPAIAPSLFRQQSIEQLKQILPRELELLGRLNNPLYKAAGDTHFKPIDWAKSFELIAEKLRATHADRTFFYSSGRSSNEAAFLLQLFTRIYGTNNINNCSYYCHQASGVGLNSTIGSGTATVQLSDVDGADLIFVIGANPASNHPRFLTKLWECRERGGEVIVINPLAEPGLKQFSVPSKWKSLLFGKTEIASLYLQPKIGGDIALLKGIAKSIFEADGTEKGFIENHTNDFETFRKDIESTDWKVLCAHSGLQQSEIQQAARLYLKSENAIFSWAMGITQHQHGVENVEAISNLALLRGMIGRKNAGLLPLRGHSNVQGVGSVGVTPALKEQVYTVLEDEFGFKMPKKPGMDTMACMHAAAEGDIDIALFLGGNLYGSNPDSAFAEKALDNIPFKLFLTTTINQGHLFGSEQESLILPVLTRDEELQRTTQESMFNFVRLSDGGIKRLNNARSEVDIIAEIAERVIENGPIDFAQFKSHQFIREAISRAIPGFEAIKEIGQTGKEFQIDGRTFHSPRFPTNNGKAHFRVTPIPDSIAAEGQFVMTSVRSEGQFNSIIYEEEDLHRKQTDRWIVLMSPQDMDAKGLKANDKVHLHNDTGKLEALSVKPFDLPQGNLVTYYPESNVLIPTTTDPRSKTPAFKSVAVELVVAG